MTFKKLVVLIAESRIKTWDDFNEIAGQVSRSFETEKITYKDYETLHSLLCIAGRAAGLH